MTLLELDKPIWHSNQYSSGITTDSALTIISYNILRGKEIEKALEVVRNYTPIAIADILLFQEVGEEEVLHAAEMFDLNYVYIPISQNVTTGKNFGNAILSKHHLHEPKKVILPHEKIINKGRRVATISKIKVNDYNVGIVSVHLETMVMQLDKRVEQLEAVMNGVNETDSNLSHVIIGGDFNTFFKKDKRTFKSIMQKSEYYNMTPDDGNTAESIYGVIKSRLDYIYCKGCIYMSSGIGPESTASDHKPIYTTVSLFH